MLEDFRIENLKANSYSNPNRWDEKVLAFPGYTSYFLLSMFMKVKMKPVRETE